MWDRLDTRGRLIQFILGVSILSAVIFTGWFIWAIWVLEPYLY